MEPENLLTGITFEDDPGTEHRQSLADEGGTEGEGGEKKTLTVEEQLAEANTRLGRYKSLDFLADELEKNPDKIHDVRAAITGKRVERGLTEHDTPPLREEKKGPKTLLEAIQQMPKEQREKLETLRTESPLEYDAALADIAANMRVESFARASQPIIDQTVTNAIKDFKGDKAGEAIYKHALPYFDQEMRDFDRDQFYGMTETARNRQLELRWSAAKAKAYDTAAEKRRPTTPRNTGPSNGGGSGGGSGGSFARERATDLESNTALAELAERSGISVKDAKRIYAEAGRDA